MTKTEESKELAEAVAKWLAEGNVIKQLPTRHAYVYGKL